MEGNVENRAPDPSQPRTNVYQPPPAVSASSGSSNRSPLDIFTPNSTMQSSAPSSRPSSDSQATQAHFPPAPGSMLDGYNLSYQSASPSHGMVGYESHQPSKSSPNTPRTAHAHLSAAGLHAQKRAYRQRRKDPSCDACRERKVKCDATDTSSCSECSSRSVKCQFTKETNRRMSTIKQVQDLEKQLANAKQQLLHFRTITRNDVPMDVDTHRPFAPCFSEARGNPRPLQRSSYIRDLSSIRSNLRRHGYGIVRPNPSYVHRHQQPATLHHHFLPPLPRLPSREVADHLLNQYFSSVHQHLPILHWPSFMQEYETAYSQDSLHGAPPIWSALLFAVFACGTLYRSQQDGQEYLEVSRSLVDPWSDTYTLDHSRVAFLISVYLTEINVKSRAWIWLGTSIRIAQDIGLHYESGHWSPFDTEVRRRAFWCIYVWDRFLSLELCRPAAIDDQDCDVALPSPAEDKYIGTKGTWVPPNVSQATIPLLPSIQVARSVSQLIQALNKPVLAATVLRSFDAHFNETLAAFPARYRTSANDGYDPHLLAPAIYAQNARLVLHRHNLSPTCIPDVRAAAVSYCVIVAKETAQILSGCMQGQPESPSEAPRFQEAWGARFAAAASTFICMHILRCTLFLCFRGEYHAALFCVQASAAIGAARVVNNACGRYLEFFLKILTSRLQQGGGGFFERDEELMAYVSGDLQGSIENSWVWQGHENDAQQDQGSALGRSEGAVVLQDVGQELPAQDPSIPQKDEKDWSGWEDIISTLEELADGQQRMHQPKLGQQARPQGQEFLYTQQLDPAATPMVSPGSSSRISIANII